MTLAEKYNAEVERLMPDIARELSVDPVIDSAWDIVIVTLNRSQFQFGVAEVILSIIEKKEAGE